jgi:hypothetical protein
LTFAAETRAGRLDSELPTSLGLASFVATVLLVRLSSQEGVADGVAAASLGGGGKWWEVKEEEESCAGKELEFKSPRPPVVCVEEGRGVGTAGRLGARGAPGVRDEESVVSRPTGGREKEAVAGGGKCTPSIVSGKHRINHARFSLKLCRVILIAPGKDQTCEEASGGGARGEKGIVFAIQQASSGGKFLVMFATGTRYLHFASIRGSSGGTRALRCHVVTGPQLPAIGGRRRLFLVPCRLENWRSKRCTHSQIEF